MKVYPSEVLSALAHGALDDVSGEAKHLALHKIGGALVDRVIDTHIRDGIRPAPLHEEYLRENLRVFSNAPILDAKLRFTRALQKNITGLVRRHHAFRHAHDGNVVWEFSGGTGTGKSSCMLGLLETLNGVKPENLARHLTIDTPDLPNILPGLPPGSGVAVDEQSHLVGEGSVTNQKVMRSVEDQIRQSGIDIYWASPESHDHATSQGEFAVLAPEPDQKCTRFVVYLNEVPLGYCRLPWCSPEMWAAYQPIKRKNVDRALRAAFQATGAQDEVIRRLFEHDAIQVACRVRRLKVADWRRLLKRFATSLGTAQVQTFAEEIEFMLETLNTRPDEFRALYGWDPAPKMEEAAGIRARE